VKIGLVSVEARKITWQSKEVKIGEVKVTQKKVDVEGGKEGVPKTGLLNAESKDVKAGFAPTQTPKVEEP
jgi:hypothetical protein